MVSHSGNKGCVRKLFFINDDIVDGERELDKSGETEVLENESSSSLSSDMGSVNECIVPGNTHAESGVDEGFEVEEEMGVYGDNRTYESDEEEEEGSNLPKLKSLFISSHRSKLPTYNSNVGNKVSKIVC